MSRYIWRKINVGFGKETTRWTAVAPAIRCPKASLDFDEKSEKVIDRIIDLCTDSDKTLLTEDLIYKMVKGLNAKYPQRCTKMLKYPQIRGKLL